MSKTNKTLTVVLIIAIVITLSLPAIASSSRKADLYYRDIKITLDGKQLTPTDVNGNAVDPFIIDGTTYLPVRAVSEALGLKAVVFGQVFRQLAAEKGLTLVELGALAEQDPQIDADIDAKIVETARNSPDIILESRLSAYMLTRNGIPALRIYLDASPEVRFARIGIREEQELKHAVEETNARQASEAKRYKMYYDIDINDRSVYDLIINTDNLTPDEVLQRILDAVKA